MSDSDNVSLSELIKKVNMLNKNIKALADLTTAIDEKFQAKIADNVDEKDASPEARVLRDKIDKIFQQKGLGRPAGSFDDKRKKYCEMINDNKIKMPRQETIEYYKLVKDANGKYSLD